jgi:hypothetical protein
MRTNRKVPFDQNPGQAGQMKMEVWQGKELQAHFLDVWQAKDLVESLFSCNVIAPREALIQLRGGRK